jgi:hypothetical protein
MAENNDPKSPVEVIPSTRGGVSAIASAHAPFIYFESAPIFALTNGIIRITLEAWRDVPGPGAGEITADRAIVAHLRMNIPAAQSLKAALEKVLLLAMPSPSESNPSGPPSKPN